MKIQLPIRAAVLLAWSIITVITPVAAQQISLRALVTPSTVMVKDGRTVAETTSDNYGDFKFDKLEEGSGSYRVEISVIGGGATSVEAVLGASINLGEIRL